MATITEILNLRTEFEEITYDFNMTSKCSSIDTIDWFLENGHRSNSLRNGFVRAKEIAQIIREYYDGTEDARRRFDF